jgi:response regulator RpfG family c-di-GMP phosphodiesterase
MNPSPTRSGTDDCLHRLTSAFSDNAIATSAALQALLASLYRRDSEGLAHAHRVALHSLRIGEELGMSHRELDELERAAWLHDIGRLAIPDPAITTTNALDGTIERRRGDQVKAVHTMTRGTPFLHPAAELVVASREYFDGSGQPNGLMGLNIPVGARVLHVADVFDALSSLCMALADTIEPVNRELVCWSGSRFDPEIVNAWLRCSDGAPPALIPWLASREQRVLRTCC